MKAIIPRTLLSTELTALRWLQGDLCSDIQITAAGEGVVLRGTSWDTDVHCSIPARVIQEGSVIFPRARLIEILAHCASDDVIASIDNSRLLIESDDYAVRLPGVRELVVPAFEETTIHAEMDAEKLHQTVLSLMFIAGDNPFDTRMGLLLHSADDVCNMVATNGHCLAVMPVATDTAPFKLQFAGRNIVRLRTFLSDTAGILSLDIGTKHFRAAVAHRTLAMNFAPNQFIPYDKLLAANGAGVDVTINAKAALGVVNRVKLLTSLERPGIKLSVTGSQLTFMSDDNSATETIDLETPATGDHVTKINSRYLKGILAAASPRALSFHFPSTTTGFISASNDHGRFVLAPMRV